MNSLWNKRIPTLLGIFLVASSVVLTSVFIKNPTTFKSGAISIDEPQNITITNISDTSFTLSYTTKDSLTGTVSFGQDTSLALTEIEDVDKEKGSISSRVIHVTTIKNLTPNTKYYFAINSGQTTFLNNNRPFEIVTGPSIATPIFAQTPINGSVILPDESIPGQTIAYLTIKGAQALSTPVNANGTYSFFLDSLRSEDLASYLKLNNNSNIKITFVNDFFSSRVLSLYGQANPLPTITLSNNYDFAIENNIPVATASPKVGGFQQILPSPSFSQSSATKSPAILVPKKDQIFINPRPKFSGTSLPNETIEITINSSDPITTAVISDKKGNWVFTPEKPLTPGPHTITIQTKDAYGIINAITQSFAVYGAQNQTSLPSSPSATPTIIPTATSTPIPTLSLTQLNQIPPTGDSNILIIALAVIALILVGIILFLLTRSKTTI